MPLPLLTPATISRAAYEPIVAWTRRLQQYATSLLVASRELREITRNEASPVKRPLDHGHSKNDLLTPDEHRLLFVFCADHPVADCVSCDAKYKPDDLGSPDSHSLGYCCPTCRADLTASARKHLATCTLILVQADEIRQRAQATRQHSVALRKRSEQARDRAEVLGVEAESARERAARLRQPAARHIDASC